MQQHQTAHQFQSTFLCSVLIILELFDLLWRRYLMLVCPIVAIFSASFLLRSSTKYNYGAFGSPAGSPEPQCSPTERELPKKTLDNPLASYCLSTFARAILAGSFAPGQPVRSLLACSLACCLPARPCVADHPTQF